MRLLSKTEFWLVMIFVTLFVAFCAVYSPAQNIYEVPNYGGGLFIAGDSSNIAPNQAISLKNVSLDVDGSLVGRWGYSCIDSTSPDTTKEIQKIFVYTLYPNVKRLVFIQNGFIYLYPNLSPPDTVNWVNRRLKITGDSLDFRNQGGEGYAVDLNSKDSCWFYANLGAGDLLTCGSDTFHVKYLNNNNDYSFYFMPVPSIRDTANYTITKRLTKPADIKQFNRKLYIVDSVGGTWVYNDTNFCNLAVVDSGTISNALKTADSLYVYNTGLVTLENFSNKVKGNSDCEWKLSFIGKVFRSVSMQGTNIYNWNFISTIIAVDTLNEILTLSDPLIINYNDSRGELKHYPQPYRIVDVISNCSLDSGFAICDYHKNWDDASFGDGYMKAFYAVLADSGFHDDGLGHVKFKTTYCNNDSAILVNRYSPYWSLSLKGKRYYVFSHSPIIEYSISHIDPFPTLRGLNFYRNSLFAFGKIQTTGDFRPSYERPIFSRVIYSDYLLPWYISYNYNFDVDANESISALFDIQNSQYIATDMGIWRMGGLPSTRTFGGDMTLSKVVTGLGIKNHDQVTVAGNDYSYFLSYGDIYKFNGYRAEKISFPIEPILAKYSSTRSLLWYFDHKLFVSFPDSSVTIVYDEERNYPYGAFYTWDFGVNAVYVMPDSNIFYFATPQHKGHIFYWPNGQYYDHFPTYNYRFPVEYQSGWQSFGDYTVNKSIDKAYFQILAPDTVWIDFYSDFIDTSAAYTIETRKTSRYMLGQVIPNVTGEYFKIRIRVDASAVQGTPASRLNIGGYKLEWTPRVSKQKSR